MKFIKENSSSHIVPIITSIGKDRGSWEGWYSLIVKADSVESIATDIEDRFDDEEGEAFFIGNQQVVIICKSINRKDLNNLGRECVDLIKERDGSSASFFVFDLFNEAAQFISEYTGGGLQAKYDGLVPFVVDNFDDVDEFIEHKNTSINSCKVLLVEDDHIVQWMVKKTLKSDFELATAQDGSSALAMYHSYNPDVVLLDINLPGKNGEEVLEQIMESDPGANVVVVSSENNIEQIVTMIEGGARGFISKPFKKEKLIRYINSCPY